ncbi:hypothetical protein SAMN02745945_00843 [Peptoclostridium litorale DSM 5388]|uniref:Transposase n=1 Tax=Peptoclostridium litorale DSM 5388 TaxID=1121324 RepID=A0A069RAT7_PEPLI|nr:hypothetical protein CLIT_23c04320 [Peptoclostridium litorale DSM 5388]SIN81623.1 hypothetical protein SAMN02745945_00843 [Peptoclostridium litorale DSM 5388]
MPNRERRKFTDDFKNQMVQLYLNGKPRKDIIAEYDLTGSCSTNKLLRPKTENSMWRFFCTNRG